MYDIDLCNGVGCPLKEQCKRYVLGAYNTDKEHRCLWWVEPKYEYGKCDNYLKAK